MPPADPVQAERRKRTDDARPAPGHASGHSPSHGQRRSRQLSDKVLLTFHAACDARDFPVARQLLSTLEDMLQRAHARSVGSVGDQRRSTEALVAAHERLWHLTNQAGLS